MKTTKITVKDQSLFLMVGKKGCGKTTACKKFIKSAIKEAKSKKEQLRVLIVSSTPEEYKSFHPIVLTGKGDIPKNKVSIISPEDFKKNDWCGTSFRDGLLIFDTPMSFSPEIAALLCVVRTFNYSAVMCFESLLDVRNPKIMQNAGYIKLFETKPLSSSERKLLNVMMCERAELFSIAEWALIYFPKGTKDKSVWINLDYCKMYCPEWIFCNAVRMYAHQIETKNTVDMLRLKGNTLIRAAEYYGVTKEKTA